MKAFDAIGYYWRLFGKVFSFFFFGVWSLSFTSLGFPLLFLCSGFSNKRFQKVLRAIVFYFFKSFVLEMRLIGVITLKVKHAERLNNLRSKVIIANHPSFLDVVILFSLIPNANCLVKGSLGDTKFVRRIVRALYIRNTLSFEEQKDEVDKSLRDGNNLIIFPEGTRTENGMPMIFKKGAARFALHAKRDIIPIYFGGNEKIGLRKHDPFLSYHPTERLHYKLDVLETIPVGPYLGKSGPAAAAHLTEEMRAVLEKRREEDPEQKRATVKSA